MTFVTAAVIATAGQVGASIYTSNKASKAMGKASQNELALQQRMFDTQRNDLAPYRAVGGSALNAYARAMGLPQFDQAAAQRESTAFKYTESGVVNAYEVKRAFNEFLGRDPTKKELKYYTGKRSGGNKLTKLATAGLAGKGGKARSRGEELFHDIVRPGQERLQSQQPEQQQQVDDDPYGGFMASPGYQFRLDEGSRGLDRNMAARGLLNSGARGKAMTRYNQGVASDEFGNYMNRLAGAAGIGQTAVNQGNNAALNFAQMGGNSMMNQGMARASGYLGMGNAINSGINNVFSALPYMGRPGNAGNKFDPNGFTGTYYSQTGRP